ncbi:MAG: hypothetical protein E6G92_12485 [Alphaproteobacteria bacterium]|nr:MAG: hypothetical protein E6G92_12485 [Alphaproteobacteria bacterium]
MSDGRPPTTEQPQPSGEGSATGLGIFRAAWHALWSHPLDYHPRVAAGGGTETLTTAAMLAEMGVAASSWEKLSLTDEHLALARQSLDEVKAQTEYQDQKATRLLTVTTFLTALSGVFFTRFSDAYPLGSVFGQVWWHAALILLSFLAFALFVLAALFGALVTFHATRTRFKYGDIKEPAADEGNPKSRLFYGPILGVRPRAWVNSFVTCPNAGAQDAPAVHAALGQRYFRDLVLETYLIAAKTADKLRYLGPAQSLLALSLRLLVAWLILMTLVGLAISPTRPSEQPQVSLEQPKDARPLRVEVTRPTAPRASGNREPQPRPPAGAER